MQRYFVYDSASTPADAHRHDLVFTAVRCSSRCTMYDLYFSNFSQLVTHSVTLHLLQKVALGLAFMHHSTCVQPLQWDVEYRECPQQSK